jgi:hypothetical protein
MTGSFFNRAAAMARQRNLQEEQTSGSAARKKNRDTVPCLIAHNAGASNAGKTKMLCAENM